MPLSPKVRSERRAQKKRLEDPPKLKRRRRCKNDGVLFPVTKPNREFCSDNCRKEFHANGGNAFGPLKTRLEKLVRQITGELERRILVLERALIAEKSVERLIRAAVESVPAQSPSLPIPAAATIPARIPRG
jgi:hypothetical protein